MAGTEEGDICNRSSCKGVMEYAPVEGCRCHIHPPCSACVDNPLFCTDCGEEVVTEHINGFVCKTDRSTRVIQNYKLRELDKTKLDYHNKPHTGFSMIKEGVYPEGMTKSEVLQEVKGTFGGRFVRFGSGKFKYIAYTD